MTNTYLPRMATITDIMDEATGARDVKTFRLKFDDEQGLDFLPGQFVLVSIFGKGEATFAVSSSSAQKDYIEVSVTLMGKVTKALHESEVGEKVGVRGPYGNSFDVDAWQGKNIILIGGGIGMAPLRPPLYSVLENRDKYGDLVVIYGARTTKDLCYLDELKELDQRDDVDVHMSIDVEEEGWEGFVGFVPTNLMEVKPGSENAIAVTCGPPIMIKFVIENLLKLGFTDEQIFTTLEMRMKCGIGKCGRCNIGKEYVCKDGPVFSYDQLKSMQGER